MSPDAVLIQQPAIDFATFLSLSRKGLGYSVAAQADKTGRKMGDAEMFLSCLASLKDENAPAGFAPHLLSHVSFSVFVAADERDLIDILECAAGLSWVRSESIARGVDVAVITGTLAQWRDACKSGASQTVEANVRILYGKIMLLFDKAGLSQVWKDFNRKPTNDHTGFYLEDKRK